MSKRFCVLLGWIQVLNLISLINSTGVSENISCNFEDESPGKVLKTSPELFYSDVLYFTSNIAGLSDSSPCWEMASSAQISVYELAVLQNDENMRLQPFQTSVIYLLTSPGNSTSTLEFLFQASITAASPRFHKSHPKLRLYTILDLSNHPFEEMANAIKKHSHNFQMNSRLHVLTETNVTTSKNIMTEVYSIQDVQVLEPLPVQIYSITNPTLYTKYNFQLAVIRATAVDSQANYPVVTYDTDSTIPKFSRGLGVFGLWDMRDMLNFSIQAMKGDDDISANKTDGFKPIGIGLQLFKNEADVSILHSYHLVDNYKYLKPLSALGEDRVYAIFRQPHPFSVRNVFLKPFQNDVWIGLSVIWTGIAVCIFAFVYLLKLRPQFQEIWEPEETILWVVATVCQRSYFLSPGSISLRLLFLFGLYFSMTSYASYSAEIISSLMAEVQPINSLADLIANKFQIISDPDKFFSFMLKDESENYEEYASKLSESYTSEINAVASLPDGFKMHFNTLDSLYLFARELNYSDSEICQLYHYIPLGFITLKSGFYVQKNSPFQEPFNLKLVMIMERGLNHRYIQNYYEETLVKCPKTKKSYREDLGFTDVFTAFAILLVGILIACLLLTIELCYHKS